MRNLFLAGSFIFLVACGSDGQEPRKEQSWQREAKFQEFLELSVRQPIDSSRHVLDTLIQFYHEDSLTLHHLVNTLTDPLSNPNSMIRNEELYIPVLEAVIASPYYDSVAKIRHRYQLEMAMKNRVGQPATDFTYTTANGRTGTLYQLTAPYVLVYINNPDCTACEEIKELMTRSEFLTGLIDSRKLIVLGIYPDEDLSYWRMHLKDMPSSWINGYDANLDIRTLELYDLRAIPSMYLLDSRKQVLLKDLTSVELLEFYLRHHR